MLRRSNWQRWKLAWLKKNDFADLENEESQLESEIADLERRIERADDADPEQARIDASRKRALDPTSLGDPPKLAFLRRETPRKQINKETAIFLQNARFLERLWEFSTAVKNETLRFAESAYRATLAKIRSFILPRPSAMDEKSRFTEIGRLEIIGQFRSRSEGALYAPIDLPDRLRLLKELPSTDQRGQAAQAFANKLRKFRDGQYADWMRVPTRENQQTLIAALDRAMSARTKPAALNEAPPPELGFNKAQDALNDFVPLADLELAWTRRQHDPDVAALNTTIRQKQEDQRAREAALEAAEDQRRAAADIEWEKGRPEREARVEAAYEAELAREKAIESRREAEEVERGKAAYDAQRTAQARKDAEERRKAVKEVPSRQMNGSASPKL